jgi:hypothetical protein
MSRRRFLLLLSLAVLALVAIAPSLASARHRGDRRLSVLHSMGRIPGPSIFGIDTETQDSNHAYYVRDIPAARRLGARFTHITLGPATGDGGLAAADYEVTTARKQGMGVVLSFGGISSACSTPTKNVHACPPRTPGDLGAYQAYFRTLVLRYRNVVQYYESWTEPNNSSSWAGGPDPAAYANLLEADYATVQSVNNEYHKQLKLLFGSPAGFQVNNDPNWIGVLPFTDQVLSHLGGAKAFDGVALHAYRFPPATDGPSTDVCDYAGGVSLTVGYSSSNCPSPDWRWLTWPQELAAYEQVFENHGYGQPPLWLTEFGWPGNPRANGSYFPSYSTQAADLRQAYNDLLGLKFVQAAMWFNVRDYQPTLATGDPAYFYHYGLLGYTFAQKPAAKAFKAMAKADGGR